MPLALALEWRLAPPASLSAEHGSVRGPGPRRRLRGDLQYTVVVRSFLAQADLSAFCTAGPAIHVQAMCDAFRPSPWRRSGAVAIPVRGGIGGCTPARRR